VRVCVLVAFLRRVVFSQVACPAVPYFTTYLINGMIFGKKSFENKLRVVIFPTTFV
jgi:hypothetical protein